MSAGGSTDDLVVGIDLGTLSGRAVPRAGQAVTSPVAAAAREAAVS